MKFIPIAFLILTISIAAVSAAPVKTFALVVDSPDSADASHKAVHSGQRLAASSKLSVPTEEAPVDLQLTGDATFAAQDSSPMTTSTSESMIRVQPGSAVSLSKMEATDTGIETVHQINLKLDQGSVLISARRLAEPSSFNLVAPAGRVAISEGTVKVSENTISVAAGRAVFYPNETKSEIADPVVLTSGHSYDTGARIVSHLSSAESSAMERQVAEFHPVGPCHFSPGNDHTEHCLSPVHPPHPPHPPHPVHPVHPPHPPHPPFPNPPGQGHQDDTPPANGTPGHGNSEIATRN